MSIHQIFYVSKAKPQITEEEIESILSTAKNFNKTKNISGALLFRGGMFLQLLEGDRTEVEALYAKIEKDPRHTHVIKFFGLTGSKRLFSEWSMAYKSLDDLDFKLITEVLSWNKLIAGSDEIDNKLILKMMSRFTGHFN